MINLHLGEIARLLGATVDGAIDGVTACGMSADTRTVRPGEIFFALRGGHEHVAEAFRKGACAAVVERDVLGRGLLLRVQSTIAALGALAGVYRLMLDARVVAVTGSNGKTTTKDMIAHILSKSRRVVRSRASFNNDIGLPLTIVSTPAEAEFLVVELGTNHPGDIARLAQWARPDAAVITSIGEAHLEGLGSLEGVAAEKASLLRHLKSGGFAVVPAEEATLAPHLCRMRSERIVLFGFDERADLRVTDFARTPEGIRFLCRGTEFRLALAGPWNALNAIAATAVAMMYGVPLPECAARLASFRPPKMRMERLEIDGTTIINDAYNANPVSTRGALLEFDRLPCRGKKIAVIGEMRELGAESDRLHEEIGRLLMELSSVDAVVTIGPAARRMGMAFHYDTVEEARSLLCAIVERGDLVLLKGSRAVGLENVVKFLAERMSEARGHAPATV
ncbi:MAG: UDP-N-acetylmuramoyl-tripeptide--D-alanyl-D-alanine ligase [Planctomycetes bacterium]|nr:UDP-N-acetylmuramoyl-tripeptide--D-alanyl-D-alanine ligase [Planctomycetota bacterium]